MNILITGGTGFIGSHLVRTLLKSGYNIWATGVPSIEKNINHDNLIILPHGPIGIDWSRLPNKIDYLFHLAANNDTCIDDDTVMQFANVETALEIFTRVVNDHQCDKIIYASSTAVYGNTPSPQLESSPSDPLNAYARSKLLLETASDIFRERYEVNIIGLRYCNVYGPGEFKKNKRASMIYQIANSILRHPIKLFGDGQQKRDYIFIDDLIQIHLLAMNLNQSAILNCGTGDSSTFNRIYEIIARLMKKTSWGFPIYIPNPYINSYQNDVQCDMSLTNTLLSFVPKFDIESGITEYHKRGWNSE